MVKFAKRPTCSTTLHLNELCGHLVDASEDNKIKATQFREFLFFYPAWTAISFIAKNYNFFPKITIYLLKRANIISPSFYINLIHNKNVWNCWRCRL